MAFHQRAIDLRAEGDVPGAIAACRKAHALFQRASGPRGLDTAHAAVELAEMLEHVGQVAESDTLLRQATRALARPARAKDTDEDVRQLYVRSLVTHSRMLQLRGRYDQADKVLQEGQRFTKTMYGLRHLASAGILVSFGVLRKAQGRYSEALNLYLKAMPILLKAKDDEALCVLYHNLGGIEHARGHYSPAEAYARRGVALRKQLSGTDNAEYAADVAALAAILDARGKREEAEKLYLQALGFFRKRYGDRSYEVAVNVGNLGALYQNDGQLKKAEVCFRKALALEEAILGKGHAETAMTMNNLAVVLAATGETKQAVRTYKRALATFASSVGKKHPHYRTCEKNLARLSAL